MTFKILPTTADTRTHQSRQRGVTLIELMCVIAIIAVLATLLLGPAGKALKNARAAQWADQADYKSDSVLSQFRQFLGQRQDFPLLTLESLEGLGVFHSAEQTFLHDRRVTFTPVAGSDPDDKVFLAVRMEPGFLTDGKTLTLTRGQLRPAP